MEGYISQIIGGSIGGLIVFIIIRIYSILTRPRLTISFNLEDTFEEMLIGNIQPPQMGLYIHLNVNNKRRSLGRGCKVFLIKLEKYNEIKKVFENESLKKHLHLKWANEDDKKEGYEGLEIPGKYCRRIDLIHSIKGDKKARFFIKIGLLGISNEIINGVYRMTIQASGENTNTTTKKFIVIWKGAFLKENISVIEESLNYKIKRFIKNKLKF